MKTMDIVEAAIFLGAHKETVRRLVVSGKLPGVKIGKGWRFIEQDLVYMRAQYPVPVTSQGAADRSKKSWRFIKETQHGGSASPTMSNAYNEALGLTIK